MNNITSPTTTSRSLSSTSEPSCTSLDPVYSKIELTTVQKLKIVFCAIVTCGGYLLYQSHQLQKALQTGKISEAEQAIQRGGWYLYNHVIGSDDVLSLALTREVEALKFLFAQIQFETLDEVAKSYSLAVNGSSLNLPKWTPAPVKKEEEKDPFKDSYLKQLVMDSSSAEIFLKKVYEALPDQKENPEAPQFFTDFYKKAIS